MTKTLPAAEVQIHLLDILDEMSEKHAELVITRDGEPVARVVPIDSARSLRSLEELRGSVTILGDIVAPLDEEWEADE